MTSCSAPRESSHLNDFARPEVPRAPIAQRLVRARVVVPVDPRPQLPPGVLVADEVVLPDALFLEAAEEALDDPVLLRRVGGDELLGQSVVATGRPEPPTLIDESVVGAEHWCRPRRAQRAEPFEARFLERPLGLFGPPPQGKLVTDELAVVTIDHRGEVGPALVGRLRRKRAVLARLLQDIEVEDQLADLLLELLDLFVLQGVLVLGARPQGIFGPEQVPLPPLLHLGHRQPVLPGRVLG